MGSGQRPQYDCYNVEDWKTELLHEAEEFYTFLVDRFVCEVVNGSVANMETAALPLVLQLEGDIQQEQHKQQNDVLPKDEQ